jgi:sigma-B regulation protein RsbU (phosphoserine phosphatase)
LTRINCDLRSILQQTGTPLFTTAFYLVADLEARQLFYSNAGHPKPFLIRGKCDTVEVLANDDGKARPALGLFEQSVYPTARRPMEAGDIVMLFTDGLYEVEGAGNEQFSPEQLLEAVRKNCRLHCEDLFGAVLKDVQQFSATHEFTDDVCLVGMEVAPTF